MPTSPPPFQIAITPAVSVDRPDTGIALATFDVTLTPPNIESPVTVDYTTVDGTATSTGLNPDYTAASGTLTFPIASSSPQTIQVSILPKTINEPDKTFFVDLSNAMIVNSTDQTVVIVNPQATGTIVNTNPAGQVQFATSNFQALPGASSAQITITRTGGDAGEAGAVFITTTSGTAVPGVDFTPVTTPVTFGFNQTSTTVNVPIINQAIATQSKTVGLQLEAPFGGAILGEQSIATLTIPSSNPFPGGQVQFSTSNFEVNQAAGTAQVTISRTGGDAGDAGAVFTTTTSGTAIPGVDFTPITTNVTFGTGQSSATVNVPINTQILSIHDLTIGLLIEEPFGGAKLGTPSTATLTIQTINPLIVTTTADSRIGSLRVAIGYADSTPAPSDPAITFAIINQGPGPFTIAPATPLPAVTRPLTIDATTQPGYVNQPMVVLNGARLLSTSGANSGAGLDVKAGHTTILGLAINGFPGAAIVLEAPGFDRVTRNLLGTDPTGTSAVPNLGDGILIVNSSDNMIYSNLISGNGNVGVDLFNAGATRNLIQNNRIGTDATGAFTVPNSFDGVFLNNAPGNMVIGNEISGNGNNGVQILNQGATRNVLLNNLIGTNPAGSAAIPNAHDGVFVNGAGGNMIVGNVLSGNRLVGVQVFGVTATGNTIQTNKIGTDATGRFAVPNLLDGVFLNDAPNNIVVTNLISGNGSTGVQLFGKGSSGEVLLGNVIGRSSFNLPLGNRFGVYLNGSPSSVSSARNVIRNNSVAQVFRAVPADPVTVNPAAVSGLSKKTARNSRSVRGLFSQAGRSSV